MAKKKTQRPKKPKKSVRRSPKWRRIKRQWKHFSANFFQKMGCIVVFLLILFALLFALVFRYLNHSIELNEEETARQEELAQKKDFVKRLVPTAQSLQREYGVLASVSLAQAMLESDFGRSQLASQDYNLYGVKTDPSDPNKALYPTLEFQNGEWVEIMDAFKHYNSWEESMREHARLIVNGTSWNPQQYAAVLAGQNYQEQARGLQSSGYATDPDYADKIIRMIEDWQLNQYDQPMTH
ncbi:glycoside hydrolase family 73 protein [Facklamia hominis]|uniref:glycoside hydrolase family 73 protein n=1 Tax=Facklamia hominis TaxID=178214 RepID=UPI0003530E24|nr:glycoside hydrolase family 73 protein [Facklamia hominis]EPH11800.1 hypothetical protein HMPREF9260_00853 [Facklamia hominis ACS-120-V-Sch10]